ncbi:MAG: FKBP-type peptidyl-prolyl cis-trans isomerase [Flavobacteriales bacterium]|nr:FKBP-type peptidyl-prolyl cis-trans isomerase [Flavobacteriales bacterium]
MKNYIPVLILFFVSCSSEEEQMELNPTNWTQENSIEMNSVFSEEEDEEIEFFLETHPDWKMTKTGTGLRHFVYQHSGNTDSVQVEDVVTVDFEITLLDGTICYTSEEKGPESFVVEKTDIESGLHEGIKLMCIGDRAKFILPSHMAHGLIGDDDKIPPLTPVIYDISLLNIEKPIEK